MKSMEEDLKSDCRPITIKQLKDFIKDCPEYDENGDPYEVWIGDGTGLNTPAWRICKLNQYDILLDINDDPV